jgi:Na+/H+ antiporter NhaD/arsenite permease-like protein
MLNPIAATTVTLELPVWSVAPFALLLLAIALLPLVAPHFWHSNRNRALVSGTFALPVVIHLAYLQFSRAQPALGALIHEVGNYVSFMLLLGSLYIVSGGIVIHGDFRPRPSTNGVLLATGAILANLIGTTGASMLLIRSLLRMNRCRRHSAHLPVFFIFLVSNLGGLLTPLGDPPLFLGFLNGVPFSWTLRLWPEWLFANGIVLAIFLVWDALAFRREPKKELAKEAGPFSFRIEGRLNVVLLAVIMAAVLLQGSWSGRLDILMGGCIMAMAAFISWRWTSKEVRRANEFSWEPIVEVAVLFAGIFVTMLPPLELLGIRGHALGLSRPWQYFWITGALSAFLDNAPTYLTIATMAAGSTDLTGLVADQVTGLDGPLVLSAISCGAVFMGALSYVGNGPNFMVKAIAEHAGYRMPSFFGYLLYSCLVLLPVFAAVTIVFFGLG